jgi:1-aminocyclopropane-1-carboxylate deaminase/D-cysteine desulfhydrase-like pyridoxal-dependent ACC family enzyme
MKGNRAAELEALIDRLPRADLANLPTPLEEAPRLSEVLGGPRIFFKRDDLTGLALGGEQDPHVRIYPGRSTSQGCYYHRRWSCRASKLLSTASRADVVEQKRVIDEGARKLAEEGNRVYMGRKSSLADLGLEAVGYVNCALELYNQMEEQDLQINRLFASSSTTTQAGLLAGAKYLNGDFQEGDLVA